MDSGYQMIYIKNTTKINTQLKIISNIIQNKSNMIFDYIIDNFLQNTGQCLVITLSKETIF